MIIFLKTVYRFNLIPSVNSNGILCRTRKKKKQDIIAKRHTLKQLKQLWTEREMGKHHKT